jgi:hypothetical protein
VSSEGGGIYGATGSTLTVKNTIASGNTANFLLEPFGKQDGDGGGLQTSGDFQNLANAGVVSLGPDDLILTDTVIRGNVGGELCTGQGLC